MKVVNIDTTRNTHTPNYGVILLYRKEICVKIVIFLFSVSTAVSYDRSIRAIRVKVPDSDEEFLLHPATVRRNDRSAQSVVRICFPSFDMWDIYDSYTSS